MLKSLRELKEALYPSLQPSLEEEKLRRAEDVRVIAILQAQGTTSLQAGHMTTRQQQDAMREEFLAHEYH